MVEIENRTRYPVAYHTGEPAKIEWGIDCDDLKSIHMNTDGSEEETKTKWRCKRCWGGVTARVDNEWNWTGFRCRVCGAEIVGEEAAVEYEAVTEREMWFAMCEYFGFSTDKSQPRGGRLFTVKRFPVLERREPRKVRSAIRKNSGLALKGRLNRRTFPDGTPGAFLLEAKFLMAAVSQFPLTGSNSIAMEARLAKDIHGEAVVDVSQHAKGLEQDGKYAQRQRETKVGTTLATAMMSAFACELIMKAIGLTCNYETVKTHDLDVLYKALPTQSQERTKYDLSEIEEIMRSNKQTFSNWRYLETPSFEQTTRNMIDVDIGRALARAARVLLDEAEVCGLKGEVEIQNKIIVEETPEGKPTFREEGKVNFNLEENPPK